jgi:hypothetical protein
VQAVKALDLIADGIGNSQWLVPRLRDHTKSADINMLNNVLDDMPGVSMSTHPCRYALGSYGPRDLGFGQSEAELVIDHLEGTDPKDVTRSFYNLDPVIARKRQMLLAWTAWLEEWAVRAIDADPLLLDREYLIEGIYRKRNGDAKLDARIAYRAARGLPLWPTLESESVAASENAN